MTGNIMLLLLLLLLRSTLTKFTSQPENYHYDQTEEEADYTNCHIKYYKEEYLFAD